MDINQTKSSKMIELPKTPNALKTIYPPPGSHGRRIQLSAIDQIAPRDYISVCLFFKMHPDSNKWRIFQTLQSALVETVRDIPELAACVQRNTKNNREEVELLFDSSKGAEIHYKDYTLEPLSDAWNYGTFDELERSHFPPNKLPRHAVLGTSAKLLGNVRLPVLVIQANFIHGGLILGTCLHHVAGDGICNILWHKTMGAHFAAITDRSHHRPICPAEFPVRCDVVEGSPDISLEEMPNWKLVEDTNRFLNPTAFDDNEALTFEYAIFFISAEKLDMLKRCISKVTPERKLGTIEVLGAFLLRHILVARDIDPNKYPEARLSVTVDSRSRMRSPEVPATYWGNFAEPNAVAHIPVSSLLKGACAPNSSDRTWNDVYPEAARKLQDAISAVNNTAVRRLVGLLNQMPKSTSLTWNVDRYPGPDMLIVCVQSQRFNDIYFGKELGYPLAMRCTVGDTEGKPDGRCVILPPRRADGKGLEVTLQYDKCTLKRLEQNAEFQEFFVRRN